MDMKTAISLPDTLFEAAERLAGRLRLSRSELYQRALAEYLARHDEAIITEQLDRVYGARAGQPARPGPRASPVGEPGAGGLVIERGEIWWAELPDPTGSEPGYRRPVVVVQADAFNRSRIGTVVVVAVTSNLDRAAAPGNVRLSRRDSRLPRESVANVSHVLTLDRGAAGREDRPLAGPRRREDRCRAAGGAGALGWKRRQGTVHIEQVLEYNEDPGYMRDLLLYKLTLAAQQRVEQSTLSRREIIRRLGTSPAQFYRLLDPANTRKTVDRLLSLFQVLDGEVDLVVRPRSGWRLAHILIFWRPHVKGGSQPAPALPFCRSPATLPRLSRHLADRAPWAGAARRRCAAPRGCARRRSRR